MREFLSPAGYPDRRRAPVPRQSPPVFVRGAGPLGACLGRQDPPGPECDVGMGSSFAYLTVDDDGLIFGHPMRLKALAKLVR